MIMTWTTQTSQTTSWSEYTDYVGEGVSFNEDIAFNADVLFGGDFDGETTWATVVPSTSAWTEQ